MNLSIEFFIDTSLYHITKSSTTINHLYNTQAYNIREPKKGEIHMKEIYEQYLKQNQNNNFQGYNDPYCNRPSVLPPGCWEKCIELSDHGPNPYVVNIHKAAEQNYYYRVALWTGEHLQLTVMSINPRDDVGLEVHPDVDQFIRIEEGQGIVMMGDSPNNLYFQEKVYEDYVILIPAGKWHNLINTGCTPLKIYVIYAPPEHPRGTIHKTKADAEEHD